MNFLSRMIQVPSFLRHLLILLSQWRFFFSLMLCIGVAWLNWKCHELLLPEECLKPCREYKAAKAAFQKRISRCIQPSFWRCPFCQIMEEWMPCFNTTQSQQTHSSSEGKNKKETEKVLRNLENKSRKILTRTILSVTFGLGLFTHSWRKRMKSSCLGPEYVIVLLYLSSMHGNTLTHSHYIRWNQPFSNNICFCLYKCQVKNPYINHKDRTGLFKTHMISKKSMTPS